MNLTYGFKDKTKVSYMDAVVRSYIDKPVVMFSQVHQLLSYIPTILIWMIKVKVLQLIDFVYDKQQRSTVLPGHG